MSKIKVACIQNNAREDWQKNMRSIRKLVSQAIQKKAKLIALPELFYWRGKSRQGERIAKEATPEIVREFCEIAKKKKLSFLLGSILESSKKRGHFYNTSLFIDSSGRVRAKYRKIHLFDNQLKGSRHKESRTVIPGSKVVSAKLKDIKLGLAVCYDLRFPELFRVLSSRGCEILFLPANFTESTGKVHWEVLLRARAIENLAYVIAPGQVGIHPETGIRSYGNSMIINPWGKVLKQATRSKEQVLIADLDLKFQNRLRRAFPVLEHRVL